MNPHFWPENPKPNFLQNWVVVSYGKSEGYKTNLDFSLNIPKPNTNPIQTQSKPIAKTAKMNISSGKTMNYEQRTMNYELTKPKTGFFTLFSPWDSAVRRPVDLRRTTHA